MELRGCASLSSVGGAPGTLLVEIWREREGQMERWENSGDGERLYMSLVPEDLEVGTGEWVQEEI